MTGIDIINSFGGDEALKSLGFKFVEQGCNSHWEIYKIFVERETDKFGCVVQHGCYGSLILSTYLCGYIGVSFCINDHRPSWRSSSLYDVFKKLQVRSFDELKAVVEIFNNWDVR